MSQLLLCFIYLFILFAISLQDQKLNGLFIDKGNARDFERPFRLSAKINEVSDQSLLDNQAGDSKPSESDSARDSSGSGSSSDEKHKL
uniref:Uncharacterized protein n=1 Tax=Rhizophora mucronata TaxID=61149 RepID=A0A2P2JUI6_RHIMU